MHKSSVLLLVLLGFAGCNSSSDPNPGLPYAPVNLSLELTNQQYAPLRADNGYVVLPVSGPAGIGGVKGVIIVRQNAGTYLAFERNCPYQPYDACALVEPDPNSPFSFIDKCCGSQFNLQGQVTGGPAARPLLQYRVGLQGTQLTVTN